MMGFRYVFWAGGVRSMTEDVYWGKKQMMKAECLGDNILFPNMKHAPFTIPDEHCSCGLYAFTSLNQTDIVNESIASITCPILVEAFGKIVEHERGFRAQYMIPRYVIHPFSLKLAEVHIRKTEYDVYGMTFAWEIRGGVNTREVDKKLAKKVAKRLGIGRITVEQAKELLCV